MTAKTVAAMDLLVPGIGEIVGGSQREERMDILLQSMDFFKLDPADYSWYLDLRKYGGAKHSGFGLGFERLVRYPHRQSPTSGTFSPSPAPPVPRILMLENAAARDRGGVVSSARRRNECKANRLFTQKISAAVPISFP